MWLISITSDVCCPSLTAYPLLQSSGWSLWADCQVVSKPLLAWQKGMWRGEDEEGEDTRVIQHKWRWWWWCWSHGTVPKWTGKGGEKESGLRQGGQVAVTNIFHSLNIHDVSDCQYTYLSSSSAVRMSQKAHLCKMCWDLLFLLHNS